MEPETSWFLVGFVNHCATTGTPIIIIFKRVWYCTAISFILSCNTAHQPIFATLRSDCAVCLFNKCVLCRTLWTLSYYLIFTIRKIPGVPVVAQWLTNPTRNYEVAGSVPALAQWVDDLALP